MITQRSHISRIMNLCACGICTGTQYWIHSYESSVHYQWSSDRKGFYGMRDSGPTGNTHYAGEFGDDTIWVPHGLCKQAQDKFPDRED